MSDVAELSPADFERFVKRVLEEEGVGLFGFEAKHQEQIHAPDGSYRFDATARFTALGADFLVLVECKHQARPVERDNIQILHDKLRSVGAHKAMLFSTSGFQRGAIAYARKHGIALVEIVDGKLIYKAKAFGTKLQYPSWLPQHVARLVAETDDGNVSISVLGIVGPPRAGRASAGYLLEHLGAEESSQA